MIEKNTVAFVKISREPVFVLELDSKAFPGLVAARRFVQSQHGSNYATDYFVPEELLTEAEAEAENKKAAMAFITAMPAEDESSSNTPPSNLLA